MPRILIGDEWYSQISSQALYETEYERILLENAERLFPDYHAVLFRSAVESSFGEAKPDFALIDRRYRLWWVVETELAHHSREHVLRQASVFRSGAYHSAHANALYAQDSSLDLEALKAMMKGVSPSVLIVVNSAHAAWRQDLETLTDCSVMIVEVFRSDRDKTMLRINGSYPEPPEMSVLTTCRCDSALYRLLILDSPGAFTQHGEETIEISFEEGTTGWRLLQVENKVWLAPIRSNPLSPGVTFKIVQMSNGGLRFEKA